MTKFALTNYGPWLRKIATFIDLLKSTITLRSNFGPYSCPTPRPN